MIEHNRTHIVVYDVIRKFASEEKPIDQNDIIKKLQEDPDNACERKTVARALERLRELYGVDEDGNWINEDIKLHYIVVKRTSSPIYKKYWLEICKDEGFTDEELMFLMLAVQFSRHVDKSFAEDIVKKLTNLSNNQYSGVFEFHTRLNEKHVPVSKDFFMTLGDINDAIRHHNMISFYINDYGTDKKMHHVGNRPIEVKPYRIVVSEGYLYLLCSERNSVAIRNIRIDKVSNIKVLDETFIYSKAQEKAVFHPNEYIIEHRYMNSGEPVNVTLDIERSILGEVIDSFGDKITIENAPGNTNRLIVRLKSSERDIVDWAMRYGGYAVITEPEYLRSEIVDRAHLLSNTYISERSEIEYLEQIENARRHRSLVLINFDLSRYESYKNLEGIWRVYLNHNGIDDFTFLTSYTSLKDLSIARNKISDPGVLSHISSLRVLGLSMTGITNLDFLNGMNITRLTLKELTLENVEALYSLPNLKMLTVNKPVARLLNRQRLKSVFGDDLKYVIEDNVSLVRLPFTDLPHAENRYSERVSEEMQGYSTCQITDVAMKAALCSKIYGGYSLSARNDKEFALIGEASVGEERIDLFMDTSRYAREEYTWYVNYEGNAIEPDLSNILTISIFKLDHGLKLVAFASRGNRERGMSFAEWRNKICCSEDNHIKYLLDNNIGWAEVSGLLERNFRRLSTINNVINPALLINYRVFEEIEIDNDGYHYSRISDQGKKEKMIAYGRIYRG